jgi:shikimate 5-dehydrogenase
MPRGVEFKDVDIYYDLTYNDNNQSVDSARNSRIVAIDGKPMLVGQAIRSFEIWTDRKVPFDPVFKQVFG